MAFPDAARVLQSVCFLRAVDPQAISDLGKDLERIELSEGEVLIHQGAPARWLYLIAQGAVETTTAEHNRPCGKSTHVAGDTLGEVEIAFAHPWGFSARATKPTTAYRLPRRSLLAFLKSRPDASASFLFIARGRRLASKLRFPWLNSDEIVYGLSRKHPIMLIRALVLPGLLLAGGMLLAWHGLSTSSPPILWLAGGAALVGLSLGVWKGIDWSNDYYVVTSQRVVAQHKVIALYDTRHEAPLYNVLSLSVGTDFLGRLLDYGDVVIRTYTGQIVFDDVGHPHAMAGMVEEHWRRARLRQSQEEEGGRSEAIRQVLDPGLPPAPPTTDQTEGVPSEPPTLDNRVGMDRWTLEVRFEEQGVITYRKHWAVLLKRIALPSLAIIVVAGLLGAFLAGWIRLTEDKSSLLVPAILLIPAGLWWIYEYMDWANDLYQITTRQIIDIHKKPLAREVRKVAPLENILGTEVDRRGIIGLVLNYGNVISNIGTEEFVFEGVYDPHAVQQDIIHALDVLREQEQRQAKQRRDKEMVEWLSLYHKEVGSQEDEGGKGDRR